MRSRVGRRRSPRSTPSMSWRAASTSGSSPCSRSVALVTGPIETIRVLRARRRRLEEEADRRGRGERHVVGVRERRGERRRRAARRPSRRALTHLDLGAARAQRVGQHVAGLGGPRDQRAADRRRPRAPRPRPSATKRSGTTSAITPCSRSARAVPGPIAATARPGQRARVLAARRQALEQQRDAVRARQADQVEAVERRQRARRARRSGSPASRAPTAPSARSRRGELGGLRPRPRDRDA